MRKILFRGKRIDNGEWLEGFYTASYDYWGDFNHHIETTQHETKVSSGYFVDPSTVGQYTGLTDKNGKKIFEGDICRNTKNGETFSVKWHGTMAGFVWNKRRKDVSLYDFGELFRAFDKYEVIGNIHDNPELLEESK